ncbi:hypothetical protein JHK87_045764 [Glycine soja]|nr:hypothetical protein JHK87_045764 [Glycine soja]
MVAGGFGKECSHVYRSCQREFLEESVSRLGLQKLSIEEVHKMTRQDLEEKIKKWIKASNIALKIFFPSERRFCDRVFFGFASASDFSFKEFCRWKGCSESSTCLRRCVTYFWSLRLCFLISLVCRSGMKRLRFGRVHYQRSSWNKVLGILKFDSNGSMPPISLAKSTKEKLKSFNTVFEEICREQSSWFVFDEQLREEIRISLEKILLPAYGNFVARF